MLDDVQIGRAAVGIDELLELARGERRAVL